MTHCYLGLGSNLRRPTRQLRKAIATLRTLPRSVITGRSSIYSSKPLGVRAQPGYCNMVIAIQTSLPAHRLLQHCQSVETGQQRIRKRRWGARTLDIDILLYGTKTIRSRKLTVPHPQMLNRDFVLIPLLEVSPSVRLPTGQLIQPWLENCKSHVIDR